jgi:uncharacterized protein (DUF779 family)
MPQRVSRVAMTDAAAALLRKLIDRHGPVIFHQSGGCCDGSAPMCYPEGEFRVGGSDLLLGHVGDDTPFWMAADQYEHWKHTHLTVDVVEGRGGGFSLEAPEGVRFLIRSRLLSDDEATALSTGPPPPKGTDLAAQANPSAE